jgi:hypothetical protein
LKRKRKAKAVAPKCAARSGLQQFFRDALQAAARQASQLCLAGNRQQPILLVVFLVLVPESLLFEDEDEKKNEEEAKTRVFRLKFDDKRGGKGRSSSGFSAFPLSAFRFSLGL